MASHDLGDPTAINIKAQNVNANVYKANTTLAMIATTLFLESLSQPHKITMIPTHIDIRI